MTLGAVAEDLGARLCSIFLRDADGRRPVFGDRRRSDGVGAATIPLFFEYFHGDTGAGPGRQPPDRLDRARREAARVDGPAAGRRALTADGPP